MFQRDQFRLSRLPSSLRTRSGLVAAGLGVTMACGAGAAVAATADGGGSGGHDETASLVSTSAAASVDKQPSTRSDAAAQAKQAKERQVKAVAKAQADRVKTAKAAAKTKAAQAKAKSATIKKAHGWTDPVDHYTLSAKFGRGGTMWSHKHSGQDFAVPTGTTVKAAHSGTVVKAGPNGAGDGPAYGNAIVIRHSDGNYSQYAHLSKIKVWVGQHVKTDQRIAFSGNTGNSSGPHLHFEIRNTPNYGSAINPLTFLRDAGVKV